MSEEPTKQQADPRLVKAIKPLGPLLEDATVEAIFVDCFDRITIERHGRLTPTDFRFESEADWIEALNRLLSLLEKQPDTHGSLLSGGLPGGWNIRAALPPVARGGGCLVMRREILSNLLKNSGHADGPGLSEAAREFLELCVALQKNVLLCGGRQTAGVLGILTAAIPPTARIAVLERKPLLQLPEHQAVYLSVSAFQNSSGSQGTPADLVNFALQMRSDWIVADPLEGDVTEPILRGILAGQLHGLATIESASAPSALVRLETELLACQPSRSPYVARREAVAAFQVLVELDQRQADGEGQVTRIVEAGGLSLTGDFLLRDLFIRHDSSGTGMLIPTGERPSFAGQVFERGLEDRIAASGALWLD